MQNFAEHVSGLPRIRKHSNLDHTCRYTERFNFVRWHRTSGSFPGDGARGQNLVHFNLLVLHELTWQLLTRKH